jgi:hypothetical protein
MGTHGRRAKTLFSILFFALPLLAQNVTQTMKIEIDKRIHTARKINGRWWSEDNRELTQTNVGWLWNVTGGNAWQLVRFDHHRPVDPARVNLLNRSMGPDQVRATLGPPNSVFPSDRPESQQQWDYYGADGYKLSIHFSSSGGIFNASFEPDAKTLPRQRKDRAGVVRGTQADPAAKADPRFAGGMAETAPRGDGEAAFSADKFNSCTLKGKYSRELRGLRESSRHSIRVNPRNSRLYF